MRNSDTIKISTTRQYNILAGMKQRCYNPSNSHYATYGGRGIDICPEWLGKDGAYEFYDWSITHGYGDDLSIERIDNDRGYYPDNCVWIPAHLNTSKNDMYLKLFYIIRFVPSFEIELLRKFIKNIPNQSEREQLTEMMNECDRRQRRARMVRVKKE